MVLLVGAHDIFMTSNACRTLSSSRTSVEFVFHSACLESSFLTMIHQFHHEEDASQHRCTDINPIGIKSLVGLLSCIAYEDRTGRLKVIDDRVIPETEVMNVGKREK